MYLKKMFFVAVATMVVFFSCDKAKNDSTATFPGLVKEGADSSVWVFNSYTIENREVLIELLANKNQTIEDFIKETDKDVSNKLPIGGRFYADNSYALYENHSYANTGYFVDRNRYRWRESGDSVIVERKSDNTIIYLYFKNGDKLKGVNSTKKDGKDVVYATFYLSRKDD